MDGDASLRGRPAKIEGVELSEVDGELVLLLPDRETVVYCNPTASLVWRLCDGQRTLGELIELLAETWPESAEAIRRDVFEVLERLTNAGCLRLEVAAPEEPPSE